MIFFKKIKKIHQTYWCGEITPYRIRWFVCLQDCWITTTVHRVPRLLRLYLPKIESCVKMGGVSVFTWNYRKVIDVQVDISRCGLDEDVVNLRFEIRKQCGANGQTRGDNHSTCERNRMTGTVIITESARNSHIFSSTESWSDLSMSEGSG